MTSVCRMALSLLCSLWLAGCLLAGEQPVGGHVQGLRGPLVLQLNGAEQLTLSTPGPFAFSSRH